MARMQLMEWEDQRWLPKSIRRGVTAYLNLFPDESALRRAEQANREQLSCLLEPVDALAVPPSLAGFRILCKGFHHFEPSYRWHVERHPVEGSPLGATWLVGYPDPRRAIDPQRNGHMTSLRTPHAHTPPALGRALES